MKKSKIELKKVKTFRGHDGVGLDCDLYVDGKKIAHVFDDARGGEVEYEAYGPGPDFQANRKILQDLETYAKTLPEIKLPANLGGGSLPMDLDSLINDILKDMEYQKFEKKLKKKFPTHILIGVPKTGQYREFSYGKPTWALSKIPKDKLQADVDKIKAQLKPKEKFINDIHLRTLGIII
jgi:hypothetical protein